MAKVNLRQLQGDLILENLKQCEHDGFVDTCRRILKLLENGDAEKITKHEVKFLLGKL